jgi:hypothetical protein
VVLRKKGVNSKTTGWRSLYDRIARFNGFIRYDYALEYR